MSYVISAVLIVSLLVNSMPTAPESVLAIAKEATISFGFWYHTSGARKLIQDRNFGQAQEQEGQAERDSRVSRIEIFPKDPVVELSDRVRFAAVAYDSEDNPVGGGKVVWSGRGAKPSERVRISQAGEFEALTPGSFTITARFRGLKEQVTVTVRATPRRDLNAIPSATREFSSRDLPPTQIALAKDAKNTEKGSTLQSRRSRSNNGTNVARREHAANATGSSAPKASTPFFLSDGWDDGNSWSADDPGNRVGDPPAAPVDGGAGSGNFQFVAPIYSSPGRGLSVSLNAVYNSRLWNKANPQISYDNDRGWPAPGFALGFGKMLGMGINSGCMLVDADGTRHSYTGSIQFFSWGTIGTMRTTDGSFIDYTYQTDTNGLITFASATLPNGTVITYGANGPGGVFPTSITDPNGNFIAITYVNNSGPRIQTVTDTLGRVITFHYDGNNLLTAITSPGLISGTRTLVRFHYHQLALSYGFSGLTASVRDANPWVVDAIYFSGTSTGYWLNDSDSYSSYGMLAKVVEERNMGFSSSGLTDMGTVTQGSVTRTQTYNYPLTPNFSLTDAPTYTTFVDSWSRDGTNFDSATTTYELFQNSTPRLTIITSPNGTKNKQLSYNAPGQYNDGLTYHDETYVIDGQPLQSSNSFWQPGAYDSPRPTRVEKTDERGQLTATEFSYGSVYNQVTEVRDYDYGGTTILRRTVTDYQNSTNYTGRHIFNLPLSIEIRDAANVRLSRVDYQYDGQTLADTPDVVMHNETHNPYSPQWEQCDCYQWDQWQIECLQWICNWVSNYNPATDYRGNLTQLTNYADGAGLTGTLTETRRYDITGNLIKTSVISGEQTTFNYTSNTQFAYATSQTLGSDSNAFAQVTTSSTYDFNTGLALSGTDANGRQSTTSYDANTLRPTSSVSPTGAHIDYAYNDAAMSLTKTSYLSAGDGGGIADQSVKLLNGRGQIRQEQSLGVNSVWDLVDTAYNNMGQVSQQSRPYRSGDTVQWVATTYDALSRTQTVTAPEGSVLQIFYNEATRPSVASSSPGETTRVQDSWGRERWGRIDARGQAVEVVEPDPNGNGSVATGGLVTTYGYNVLGQLTQITQGAQTRIFKYDSLGRLTAQKLAEVNATLNNAGTYVGSGAWSDVFTYDERSNLTSRTDARGVKTVYNFNNDPLNRLQSISWDTTGFGDTSNPILSAATVTYSYLTKTTGSQLLDITQVSGVTASGVSTESYSYDTEGRVSSRTLTLSSRGSFPFVTDYVYDSLDRIKNVTYPAEYGNGAAPRKLVHHDYDIASRLNGLTYGGQTQASNIVYNAANQSTSLSIGTGPNQVVENYGYNAQTGWMDSQTVTRGASTLLNLSYDYVGANGKRTGQLKKILNNLNHNKDRGFSYDAVGRLVQATGGPSASPLWTQTYAFDRYGNRTSVSASGFSAKLERRPAQPPRDLLAKNTVELPAFLRDDTKSLSDSPLRLRGEEGEPGALPATTAPFQSGPPVFTNDPLVAGTTLIQAIHVTELRDAINLLRPRAGLGTVSWAEAVTAGTTVIKASHITEMRTRLEEARAALALAATSYTDPTLTPGTTVKAAHIQEIRSSLKAAWNSSSQISRDGHAAISYDTATNRITTAGFAYDAAGNQVRALTAGGSVSQRFQYDAANRLVKVKADDNTTVLATYTYGHTNERLIAEEGGVRTYYVAELGTTLAEFTEVGASVNPAWSKHYIYLADRLLSTLTPNGSGGESVEYHHPDRLGTRIVSNPATGTSFEQVTLAFGTALTAESTGSNNRKFTTYDRSATSGLDYAVNRHYDPQQGRFTQVDPIGMESVSLSSPQTLNLYAYCMNDPVNHTDSSGLGFLSFLKKVFNFIKKVVKWVLVALTIAVAVVAVVFFPVIGVFISTLAAWLETIGAVANAAGTLLGALGLNKASAIFGIIGAGATLIGSIISLTNVIRAAANEFKKVLLDVVTKAISFTSQVLSALGHTLAARWLNLVGSVTEFLSGSFKEIAGHFAFNPSGWEIFGFVQSTAQQIATLAGETKLADILDVAGIVQDIRTMLRARRAGQAPPPTQVIWNGGVHQMTVRDQNVWRLYNAIESDRRGTAAYANLLRRVEKGVALVRGQ
jgi:RHS repeat-associated protein